MRYLYILIIVTSLCRCGVKDSVDYHDRFDLDNTVDTTKDTYNPRVDSTYFFPADSSDIVKVEEYGDYKVQTTIFPVRNKYVILFHTHLDKDSKITESKVKYRDYKLQVNITDPEGLHIKRVITKYDIPKSILTTPNYYFIRNVKFKGREGDEFRFDITISHSDDDDPAVVVKYYIHLVDGLRFENYPKAFYDSLNPEPDEF